jgi:hypothetical protein
MARLEQLRMQVRQINVLLVVLSYAIVNRTTVHSVVDLLLGRKGCCLLLRASPGTILQAASEARQ